MAGAALFQELMDLFYGIVHAAVVDTDDLIFFKIFFHGTADRFQEIPDACAVIVQIKHTGHEIFFFIQNCLILHYFLLHSLSLCLTPKTDPDHIPY